MSVFPVAPCHHGFIGMSRNSTTSSPSISVFSYTLEANRNYIFNSNNKHLYNIYRAVITILIYIYLDLCKHIIYTYYIVLHT